MAAALGLGLTTLHRYLRIFDLPEGVVTRFRDGALSMSDVEVILDADPRIRVELADWLSQRDLRKDEARRLSRRLADPAAPRDWVDAACEQLGSETVEVHPATDGGISLRIVAADPESLRQSLTELLRRVDRLDSDSHGRSAERF
jgi:hypothetical protein